MIRSRINKSISVIIPNYNGIRLLEEYLPYTVEALHHAAATYEIIVVDDCSTDDSVHFVQNHYPQIKILVNQENRGFSYTCNQGIAIAQYDLVLLLNSDVKLTPTYFDQQWKYFKKEDTFGVMGRIMSRNGEKIEDAARMLDLYGGKLKTNRHFYTVNDNNVYTAYLSGANALVDRKKLLEIGGFNELFSPFYYEDLDLGLRAWRMGWKCYYEHEAVCFHQVSASTKKYKTARWVKQVYFRNRFMLHALHMEGPQLYIYFMRIILIDLLPMLLVGNFWIWKSYVEFFKRRNDIIAAKNQYPGTIKSNRARFSLLDVMAFLRETLRTKQIVRVY
ncbi:glycosyltransferase family 2 protein [Olivibacter ginsenosidimutans]|uniref:glycosyltransferase family 2 protein n=1 Tax=Olivibacter ginsenosidimutans TaxID=1176537 RepID=UPI0031E9E9F8